VGSGLARVDCRVCAYAWAFLLRFGEGLLDQNETVNYLMTGSLWERPYRKET